MNTIINIKKISLIFFLVSGFLHLGSSIFLANSLFVKEMEILNRIVDIPFIITGMIYGFASLRITLTEPQKNYKVLDISLSSIIILTLIALIIINLVL